MAANCLFEFGPAESDSYCCWKGAILTRDVIQWDYRNLNGNMFVKIFYIKLFIQFYCYIITYINYAYIYIYMRYRNKILILIEECKIYDVYKIMK